MSGKSACVVAWVLSSIVLCLPGPAWAAPEIAVRPGVAAFPYDPDCARPSGLAFLRASGQLSRLLLPDGGSGAVVDASRAGFAAVWSNKRNVRSANVDQRGWKQVVEHGLLSRYGSYDIELDDAGNRTVVWQATDGINLQRVAPDGTASPPLLLQPGQEDDILGPEILSIDPDGAAWVAWHPSDTLSVVMARRVPPAGPPGPPVKLFETRQYAVFAEVLDAVGDQAGGLFGLVRWDDNDDTGDSGVGPPTGALVAVHITSAGAVKRTRVARGYAVGGAMSAVRGRPHIIYDGYHHRRAGVYVRTLRPGATLSSPRRVAGKGDVVDAATQPGTRRLLTLLKRSGRTDRLSLFRVPSKGAVRHPLTIADGGYRPEGDARGISDGRVALDSQGHTFLSWGSDVGLATDSAAYVRTGFGRRLRPARALWRCPH